MVSLHDVSNFSNGISTVCLPSTRNIHLVYIASPLIAIQTCAYLMHLLIKISNEYVMIHKYRGKHSNYNGDTSGKMSIIS